MIAKPCFAKLVAAILALITRMRDINTELTKRVAHLTRKRPRSETLGSNDSSCCLSTASA